MTSKRTPINPAFREYGEGEMHLTILDFENNNNALIDAILSHVKKATCKDCQWYIHLIDTIDLDISLSKNKECLLKIFLEKELVGKSLENLKNEFDVRQSPLKTFQCVVLVYCLTPIIPQD